MTVQADSGGVLTLVDVLQIQPFVFASNRLRDIVAGSSLVEKASSLATLEGCMRTSPAASASPPEAPTGDVVFAAGGNALLDFPDAAGTRGSERAKDFAARYSRQVIEEFPGLRVAVHHEPYRPGERGEAFVRAGRGMQARKLGLPAGAPMLGLSVTAECAETRAVATHLVRRVDGRVVPASGSIAVRRKHDLDAARWRQFLPARYTPRWNGFRLEFPLEVDLLGRQIGETSLIGVVHVDGNGVGQRVLQWARDQGDAVCSGLKVLSKELEAVVEAAMRNVVRRVCDSLELESVPPSERTVPVVRSRLGERRFALTTSGDAPDGTPSGGLPVCYLPIRPVLLGGDDLTFVCDGRIALDLARIALEAFKSTPVPAFEGPIGASAGVAIVKSHAPFARAYALAADLCNSSKAHLRRKEDARAQYGLDWHVGFTMPSERIEELRRRQYRAGDWELTCRPYQLGSTQIPYTFAWLDEVVLGAEAGPEGGFHGPFWSDRRSKVKRLAQIVRRGPDAVADALDAWTVTADVDALPGKLKDASGFKGTRTPLLDAVELLDVHLPLRRA